MTQPTEPAIWFPQIETDSGVDVFTKRLIQQLRKSGLNAQATPLPVRAEYAPWTVRRPPTPSWANVIHVNTWLPTRFLPTRGTIVATCHLCVHDAAFRPYKTLSQMLYHRYWIRSIERRLIQRADAVIGVSGPTARCVEQTFGKTAQVIRNGIDPNGPFQPKPRARPQDPFTLLYSGNWSKRKGTDILAPLMARLGKGFVLEVTADRKEKGARTRLPANMRFVARAYSEQEMAAIYQRADALLFPSRLEGLSLTLLEGMACGLPVIAADTASTREVVINQKHGFLCRQDDISEFAAAAKYLAKNHQIWQQMRRAARAHIIHRFGLEAMVNEYITVYRNLLNRTRTPN